MKRKTKIHATTVNIPPYGTMKIVGAPGDKSLATFKKNRPALWPKVKRHLNGMLRDFKDSFETPIRLTGQKWVGEGCRLDPDVFMGDQADLYLRIYLEEPPDGDGTWPSWDFFVKGTTVAHSQPAY